MLKSFSPLRSGVFMALLALALAASPRSLAVQEISVDVCVYGGTSGGVIAAVQAARLGKTVALVTAGSHLGGMTSGGLGATDIGSFGNGYIQGTAREFYTRIGQAYGTGAKFAFEPHVAETVFNRMIQEAGVAVYTNQYLVSATKAGAELLAVTMNNGNVFRAKMFIDASYEGDLLAAAGVSYTVGREASAQYGEPLNGVRPPNSGGHQFGSLAVDPYVVPGDPASGLLPFIQPGVAAPAGSADAHVQAYNFRLCLTQTATNQLPIAAPENYSPTNYELLARYIAALQAQGITPQLKTFMNIAAMPNGKTDINNNGPVSTDFIGESTAYIEADAATRAQIWQAHKNYQQGLLYFLATDPRVPDAVRSAMSSYGFCRDEFTDTGGWPAQLYVREARRMISDYVMTESNCLGKVVAPDSIGLAAYTMDSHNCHRFAINGSAQNEGDTYVGGAIPGVYPVAYRAIIPKAQDCANLLVPWCLSASHIGFGSIRMEPVFMILSQSAATAACLAIDDGVSVQALNVAKLQAQLQADGQMLAPAATASPTTNDAPALLLDLGPTAVATLADKLNSPAHAVGGLAGSQTNWNTGLTGDAGSGLIYSDGTAAAGVTVDLGRSTAGTGVIDFSDNHFIGTNTLGLSLNTGVYAGNSPVKDGIYGGAGGTNALAVGARVSGLPAGNYLVYVAGRNTSTPNAVPERFYYTNGPAQGSFNFVNAAFVDAANASPALTSAFALGNNCQSFPVTLAAGQSLFLAAAGSGASEQRGFLNTIEILTNSALARPTVTLWATDAQASRFGPAPGSFTVSRSGATNLPLIVQLTIAGTASNGIDYLAIPTSLVLPAGVATTNLAVQPLPATQPVGDQTAMIALASNVDYVVGDLHAAAIAIQDVPLNAWRLRWFGANATNPAVAGNNASPAGDGVPNLLKYALGLDPLQPTNRAWMQFDVGPDGYFELTYTRPDPAPADIGYEVETSSNLVVWCTNACAVTRSVTCHADNTATVVCTSQLPASASAKEFMRLRVRPRAPRNLLGARVVAFGDSITYGYGVPPETNWVSQLQARFNLDMINAGVSGNTSSQGLARIQNDVLAARPGFVIINFGMNDHVMTSLDHPQVSQTTFCNNLSSMIDQVRRINAIPILVTVNYLIEGDATQYYYHRHPAAYYANVGGAQAWLDRYLEIVRALAAEKNVDLVDVRAACDQYDRYQFLRSLVNGAATDDGVHPYLLGSNVYARLIGDYLAAHYFQPAE
jgi:lysophospholipase L1-like esterase